ncbi:MAG TPA: M23 family metallopeptidase [Gemmatimonadaceae bacterium]|nr:M23 family metallopeptidase [Gemmatimonadaceae bacterium]
MTSPRRSPASTLPDLHLRRVAGLLAIVAAIATTAACEYVRDQTTTVAKQDTTTLPASAGAGPVADDTLVGVPAVPGDTGTESLSDTGIIHIAPEVPSRGGAVFALVEGVAEPRCTWRGERLPCHRHGRGILAIVPLPPNEPAGTYSLVVERPGGRVARQIVVADQEMGRELVFVNDSIYRRIASSRAEIAREARALQRVLATDSPERRWSGAWRSPVPGTASGFGAERFYYPASDSTRAIRIDSGLRTIGVFGVDTAAAGSGAVPGWRLGGVDYDVRAGTQAVAPAAAVVADVGDYTVSGRTLVLDHGAGILTAYYHLDTVLVREGDVVPAGRPLGRVGATGLTARPRLHFAVFIHGRPVEPRVLREIPPFAR